MQVSPYVSDTDHAIVGGKNVKSFGISNSTEFFTVLSSSLYRDKHVAVVREVICNAWDAHIVTGNTNEPVRVELTDEKLVISDSGPGIADDRMQEVYCIYGASTKTGDGEQTGGFGLGSKAPFAYTDHFTVTSCHNGIKTVYAISRTGIDACGTPTISVLVKTKTTETGVSVSIPLGSKNDRLHFESAIRSVVMRGGIQATLCGEKLPTTNYDKARKHGYLVVSRGWDDSIKYSLSLYVLVGSVLYAVDETNSRMRNIVERINKELNTERGFAPIIIAEPGTVGITPSRESLSYTEGTMVALERAVDRVITSVKANEAKALRIFADHVAGKYTIEEILPGRHGIIERIISEHIGGVIATDINVIALQRNNTFKKVPEIYAAIIKAYARKYPRKYGYLKSAVRELTARRHEYAKKMQINAYLGWDHTTDISAAISKPVIKKIFRMAARAGATDKLVYSLIGGYLYSTIAEVKPAKCRKGVPMSGNIVIARSKYALSEYVKKRGSNNHGDHRIASFVIPDNSAYDEMRKTIAEEGEKFGFTVSFADSIAPKKNRNKTKNTPFISAGDTLLMKRQIASIEKPSYYLNIDRNMDGYLVQSLGRIARKTDMFSKYQNVAYCTSARTRRRAQKLGAKNLMDELVKDVTSVRSKRTVRLAVALACGKITKAQEGKWDVIVSHSIRILAVKPVMFFEFIKVSPPNKKEILSLAAKIEFMDRMLLSRNGFCPARNPDASNKWATFKKLMFEEVDEYLLPHKEFMEKFKGINAISLDLANTSDATVSKLIKVIKRSAS